MSATAAAYVPLEANTCGSCRAEIVWAITCQRKRMPIDPQAAEWRRTNPRRR